MKARLVGIVLTVVLWAACSVNVRGGEGMLQWIATVHLTPATGGAECRTLSGERDFTEDLNGTWQKAKKLAQDDASRKWAAAYSRVEVVSLALLAQRVSPQLAPPEAADCNRSLAAAVWIFPRNSERKGVEIKTPALEIADIPIPSIHMDFSSETCRQSVDFALETKKVQWCVLLPDGDRERVTFELKREKQGATGGDSRTCRWLRNGSVTDIDPGDVGVRWYLGCFDYHRVGLSPGAAPVHAGGEEQSAEGSISKSNGVELTQKYRKGFWVFAYKVQ